MLEKTFFHVFAQFSSFLEQEVILLAVNSSWVEVGILPTAK
jgi:hypothetical protein